MFAIFGFFFIVIKVFLYSLCYTLFTILILYLLSRVSKKAWIKSLLGFKFKLFVSLWIFYGFLFFLYSFSYWRSSGLGDDARIPIGNGYSIGNIDASTTYFEYEKNNSGKQAFLNKFIISDGKLCSQFAGYNSTNCYECFIVFDIENEKLYEFNSLNSYESFARLNNLPSSKQFKDFLENYNTYWSSNNKWYLP